MNESEERLQERLERLETGDPVAVCLADLPSEEAELLMLAATLRETAYPVLDSETAVAQRAHLQRLALRNQRQNSVPAGIVSRLLNWWQVQTAVRRGAAVTLAGVLVILLVVGVSSLFPPDDAGRSVAVVEVESSATPPVAQTPTVDFALLPETETAVSTEPAVKDPGNAVSTPAASSPLDISPKTAVLENIRGVVEIQTEEGGWTAVSPAAALKAGQRVRTGALSQVSLTFYDGSQTTLGPQTELSLDALDAQLPADGFRTVVMTQWLGESEHKVQFRNDSGSRYEVKTPNGSGIARGTTFQVLVTADLRAQYAVVEGRVDVTGRNVTVSVTAGQISAIPAGEAPSPPAFRVTGEGEVSQIGPEWIIGGQTFQTDDHTVISGGPQVGDWVRVEGHLLPDGARLADRILLLRRSPANRFAISGQVDTIGATSWMVSGQTIAVNEETAIEAGITEGDVIQVDGLIQEDGSLLAERIRLIEANAGLPFEFTGIVQTMTGDAWAISGIAVAINADTEIEDEIVVGDVVRVEGRILDDDTWLAHEIKLVEVEENRFEITGSVDSMDPWIVAGVPFEIRDWTEIEEGIGVGDLVKAEGLILADGVWVADEIKLLDEADSLTFEFYGTVDGIAPWIVSGILLPVTEDTAVDNGIEVGDLVRVTVTILPDGTWLVEQIILVNDAGDDEGCFSVTAVVISVSDNQITLDGWPAFQLGDEVEIDGQITAGSVVTIYACANENGTFIVIEIIIIYSPHPGDVPPPPPPAEGAKATLCHKPGSKNPHTITVNQSAVPAHLAHGDTPGPCP